MKIFIFLIFPLIVLAQDNYEFGPSGMVNDDAPGDSAPIGIDC